MPKQYLEELLSPFGKVEVSREVTDEVRQVDILFSPAPSANADLRSLGLLGRIATTASLRQNIPERITSWRITVINQENLTADDQEVIMNLSQAYLEWRKATLQEGVQE